MNVFLAGTNVTLTIPLTDLSGNAIEPAEVSYRVLSAQGVELVSSTPYAVQTGDTQVVITVLAANNALEANAIRDARSIELTCLVNDNTIVIPYVYGIVAAQPLVVGVNSFQTFAQAQVVGMLLADLTGWNSASQEQQIAALIEARDHINQLNFHAVNFGQDHIVYGSGPGSLEYLTELQFAALPDRFKTALASAQVAEADFILGGSPIDERRRNGLMLESIGEVKQMFRPGKPLELPVCKRALRYLSPYVTFNKTIGRG